MIHYNVLCTTQQCVLSRGSTTDHSMCERSHCIQNASYCMNTQMVDRYSLERK